MTSKIHLSRRNFLKGLSLSGAAVRIGLPPLDEGEGVTTINETIDASVFDRWRADQTYRPPQLRSRPTTGWHSSPGITAILCVHQSAI